MEENNQDQSSYQRYWKQKLVQTKSWSFEKINKIDKLLVRLTNIKKKEDTNKHYKNKTGNTPTEYSAIESIWKEYCKQHCT
jgi:hypothetical protein